MRRNKYRSKSFHGGLVGLDRPVAVNAIALDGKNVPNNTSF